MPTDPNDKMRTPGAERRRDMDGRAYRSQKKGCRNAAALLLLPMLVVPAGAVWGLVDFAEQVGRWTA